LLMSCPFLDQIVLRAEAQAAADPLKQHYDAAENLLRKGDMDRAAVEYKAFLGEAIHRVANARALAGDLTAAAQTFDEALAFTGSDTATRLDYASVLSDASRWSEARAVTQSVVDQEPRNNRARVILGKVFFELRDYPAAKAQFEAAAALGDIDQVWRLMSITYLRLQELATARSLFAKMIATLGDTPANHVAVAMAYYYGDYPDQAVEELKKAIARDGTTPGAHYYLGLAYMARNEEAGYPKAIPEFRLQLKINPDDFASHYMLSHIALQQRDFDESERQLMRAAALSPDDRSTQLLLGQLYSETRRGPMADTVLRKLIASSDETAPDYQLIRAHYMLGRILLDAGHADDGASEISKSEQLRKQMRLSSAEVSGSRVASPGSASSKSIEGLSRRQNPPTASGKQRAQAEAFISKISPAIAESYFNLGGIASRRQDPAAAQYLQKAGQWDPSLVRRQ
jgi:tetratricopeptide (TPR) repeat protein